MTSTYLNSSSIATYQIKRYGWADEPVITEVGLGFCRAICTFGIVLQLGYCVTFVSRESRARCDNRGSTPLRPVWRCRCGQVNR